jgi:hypothetical protein
MMRLKCDLLSFQHVLVVTPIRRGRLVGIMGIWEGLSISSGSEGVQVDLDASLYPPLHPPRLQTNYIAVLGRQNAELCLAVLGWWVP